MKTYFLKAACLAAATMLLAPCANAANLTILSVNESLRIVDVPNSIDFTVSSTDPAGTTTTNSAGGFDGTIQSSHSGSGGSLSSEFQIGVPVILDSALSTRIRGTSVVRFIANQNHHLVGIGAGSSSSGVSGSIPAPGGGFDPVFIANLDSLNVATLFDVTSNELVTRMINGGDGGPPYTIDGVDVGPQIEPDYAAVFPPDGIFLRMGHEYTLTTEVESSIDIIVPNDPRIVLSGILGTSRSGFLQVALTVPEPSSIGLLGLATVGLSFKRRRLL